MDRYYFLVAALPMLSFSKKPVLSYRQFVDFCYGKLTEKDFTQLSECRLDDFEIKLLNRHVYSQWQIWEINLRNNLVKLRTQKKKISPEKYLKEIQEKTGLRDIAVEAFNQINPLESEVYLDKKRWDFLDSLEAGHFFDLEKVIIYSLKLQLLEKKELYTQERGEGEFNTLIGKKKEGIKKL